MTQWKIRIAKDLLVSVALIQLDGFIESYLFLVDLAEVMSVTQAPPAPGPPKKTDDKSFFDVSIF